MILAALDSRSNAQSHLTRGYDSWKFVDVKARITVITRIRTAKHQPRRAMVFVKSAARRQERNFPRRYGKLINHQDRLTLASA